MIIQKAPPKYPLILTSQNILAGDFTVKYIEVLPKAIHITPYKKYSLALISDFFFGLLFLPQI